MHVVDRPAGHAVEVARLAHAGQRGDLAPAQALRALDEAGDVELERRRVEARERRLDAVDAPAAAEAGEDVAEAARGARNGAREEAAQLRRDGDAADARGERAEQRRAPDRKSLARGRGGPFHGLTVPPGSRLPRPRAPSSPQLHESPVRRISPFAGRDHDRAQPAAARRAAARARPASTQPSRSSARAADLDARDAAHLDGVRRAEQPGPHLGLVPGDEERPSRRAPPRARRGARSGACRRAARARRARARARAGARAARCRRSRSTSPSAGRRWPCAPAASGPSDRAAPRSRRRRR